MTVKRSRPISPHLQVYRLPLTGLISITHRITGIFLSVGLLLVVMLFYVLSKGGDSYLVMQDIMAFWLLKIVYWGFIFALFFHLCHGFRHLFWDLGEGFDAQHLMQFALIEIIWAVALTLGAGIFL